MIYNYVMCTVISGVKIEGTMMDVYVLYIRMYVHVQCALHCWSFV